VNDQYIASDSEALLVYRRFSTIGGLHIVCIFEGDGLSEDQTNENSYWERY